MLGTRMGAGDGLFQTRIPLEELEGLQRQHLFPGGGRRQTCAEEHPKKKGVWHRRAAFEPGPRPAAP